jgi:PAS domain S-box-containing protein/diguanylate cyclase (GGDEF)-like protein
MATPALDLRQAIVEQALRDAALHKALVDQLEEGVYIVDRERRILFWNAAAERISGYMEHEVAGHFCQANFLMHCSDWEGAILCGCSCPMSEAMQDGKPRESTIFLRHRDGHRVPVHVRTHAICDAGGAVIGGVEIFQEAVAPARVGLHALEACGCLDKFTGAANRKYGETRVRQAMEVLDLHGIPFGWLRISLDRATELEQIHGKQAIAAALKTVAATLDRNIGSFDVLTRWSESEFRIEAHNCTWPELEAMAKKLVALVGASSLVWCDNRLSISISVAGVTAEHGDTLESLETRAGRNVSKLPGQWGQPLGVGSQDY